MVNREDVQMALEEHEQRTHEKIGKEYSTIMNEFNENLKMLMDATVSSYKRLETFVKEEVQTMKRSILKDLGTTETAVSDPLEQKPNIQQKNSQDTIKKFRCSFKNCNFQTFVLTKLNEHNALEHQSTTTVEKKKRRTKKEMKAARSLNAEQSNLKEDLYNKWDNVNFLQQGSMRSKLNNSGVGLLSVKLEATEEYDPSEGYGSMETDGDEFTNTINNSSVTVFSGNQDQPNNNLVPGMKGKVDDFIKKIDKFVMTNSATNQKRRLVGCKLCDIELRTDRIRVHIQKEHPSHIANEISTSEEKDRNNQGSLQVVRLDKNKNIAPKRELNAEAFSSSFDVNGKRARERPRAKCTLCNKEMRKDGIKLHMQKVHSSELASAEQEDDPMMQQYTTQNISGITETDQQDQSDDEEGEGHENQHDGSPEPEEESEFQDDTAQDILSKFDQIRQHLEEVDSIEK